MLDNEHTTVAAMNATPEKRHNLSGAYDTTSAASVAKALALAQRTTDILAKHPPPPRIPPAEETSSGTAASADPGKAKPARKVRTPRQRDTAQTDADTFGAIKLSDVALPHLRGRFRWCAELGWLAYDGTKWAENGEPHALSAVAGAVRHYTAGILTRRALTREDCIEIAGFSGSSQQNHALKLLRTAEGICTDWKAFDALPNVAFGEPWKVPCANGVTIELYPDGAKKVRPTGADDLNTMTACAYDPTATAPNIAKAFKDYQPDENVRRFQLQMWCRGLSGMGAENFICNLGEGGRNGKGTTMTLLKAVFGDYAQQIPVQVILRARTDNQQTYRSELAKLRGKRFVCCEEPGEGAQYDEGMVKLLTGGGEVPGRAMNRNGVTFNANWLFEMAANARPGWKADDALTGRYVEISWDFLILKTATGVQEGFKQRLLAETSGLLNAILANWYGEGKPPVPDAVVRQTAIGNAAASPVAGFVRDALLRSPEEKIYAADLYAGYLTWAKTPGSGVVVPMTPQKFGREIPRCGIGKADDRKGTFYIGVTLHERYETGAFRIT